MALPRLRAPTFDTHLPRPEEPCWVTVVDCGTPVWMKATMVKVHGSKKQYEVELESGERLCVPWQYVRSIAWLDELVS